MLGKFSPVSNKSKVEIPAMAPSLSVKVNNGKAATLWTVAEVQTWLGSLNGFSDYIDCFGNHEVDGSTLAKLDADLLKEIGVTKVGKRAQLLNEIDKMKVIARTESRNTVVWSGEEYFPGCCNSGLNCFNCPQYGCGVYPLEYKLYNVKLDITTKETGCCCFGPAASSINSVDISEINDVDVGIVAACCTCGPAPGQIKILTQKNEELFIILRSTEVKKVGDLINNVKEEATMQRV